MHYEPSCHLPWSQKTFTVSCIRQGGGFGDEEDDEDDDEEDGEEDEEVDEFEEEDDEDEEEVCTHVGRHSTSPSETLQACFE